jgi:hypothetical protein
LENNVAKMTGVTEYVDRDYVELVHRRCLRKSVAPEDQQDGEGRWVIRASNECGNNCTEVDVVELISWLRANRPEFLVIKKQRSNRKPA